MRVLEWRLFLQITLHVDRQRKIKLVWDGCHFLNAAGKHLFHLFHQDFFTHLEFEQTCSFGTDVVYTFSPPSHTQLQVIRIFQSHKNCNKSLSDNLQKATDSDRNETKIKKKKKGIGAVSSTSDIQQHAANLCVSLFSPFWHCQSDSLQMLPWLF